MRIGKYMLYLILVIIIAIAIAAYYLVIPRVTYIDSGGLDFLAIGRTKEQVLADARKADVVAIKPLVYEEIKIRQRDKLPLLYEARGIEFVTQGPDHVYISFREGSVDFLSYLPQYKKKYSSYFWIRQDKQLAFKNLDRLMQKYPQSYVYNRIPNLHWVYLDQGDISPENLEFLVNHDRWFFFWRKESIQFI